MTDITRVTGSAYLERERGEGRGEKGEREGREGRRRVW